MKDQNHRPLSEAIHPKTLTDTERTLDVLLTHHIEAQDTMHSGIGASADSSWGFQPPCTWTVDHEELRMLLKLHRMHSRNQERRRAEERAIEQPQEFVEVAWRGDYWHLSQWYLTCRWTRVNVTRIDKKGRSYQVDGEFERVAKRHEHVDAKRVYQGLGWIDLAWERVVFPRLGRGPQWIPWWKLLEPKAAA